jgi:hypothetical protein
LCAISAIAFALAGDAPDSTANELSLDLPRSGLEDRDAGRVDGPAVAEIGPAALRMGEKRGERLLKTARRGGTLTGKLNSEP